MHTSPQITYIPRPLPTHTHMHTSPQITYFSGQIIYIARFLCLDDLDATIGNISATYFYVVSIGVQFWCYACLFEGKSVPEFPLCLCRRCSMCRQNTAQKISAYGTEREVSSRGLQFTANLGRMLALLTKHGLDPHP